MRTKNRGVQVASGPYPSRAEVVLGSASGLNALRFKFSHLDRAWAGHSDEAWTVSLSTDGGAAATASAPLVPRGLTVVTAATAPSWHVAV